MIDTINANTKKRDTENENADRLAVKHKTDEAALGAAKTELQTLGDVGAAVETLRNKEATTTIRKAGLLSLQTSITDYNSLLASLERTQEDYQKKSETSQVLRIEYESLHKAYLDEQAGVLAAELKPDEPCPVCGSTEHPAPAMLSSDAPTKSELNKADKKAKDAEKETVTASEAASTLKGQITAKKKEIESTSTTLLSEVAFDEIPTAVTKALDSVKNELDQIAEQLNEQEKTVARKKVLNNEIPTMEQNLAITAKELANTRELVIALASTIISDTGTRDKQAAALTFKDETEASNAIAALRTRQKAYEDALVAAQTAFDAAKATAGGTVKEIDTLKAGITEEEPLDLETLKKEKEITEGSQADLNERNRKLNTHKSTNQTAMTNLQKAAKALSEAETRYQWMKELSDTANGDVIGKEKIKLEGSEYPPV